MGKSPGREERDQFYAFACEIFIIRA